MDVVFLFEPTRRCSAAAVAAGVATILRDQGPDAVIVALPCDHLIRDEAAFAASIGEAKALAGHGLLCKFDLVPAFPSTEFGYIQRGAAVPGHGNSYMVENFHEKPNLEIALSCVGTPGFYWNSGMFAFQANTFVREAERHMSDVWRAADSAVQLMRQVGSNRWLDAASFASAPKISIDYGLMEKSGAVGGVPAAIAWSEVGNLAAVHDISKSSSGGLVTYGDVATDDASNTLIHAEGIKVIVAGVRDRVIVATPDGVFVSRKDLAPIVKQLLEGGAS